MVALIGNLYANIVRKIGNKMKTTKWIGFNFNKNGWSETHENHSNAADQFARDFRSDLKQMLKGSEWEVYNFHPNWFCGSGFLYNKEKDKWVYFSHSDTRYFQDSWNDHLLIRTAKHEKDYTGGSNHYCSFSDILETIDKELYRCYN